MMTEKGKILLFPCPISEGKIESLSTESIRMLHHTTSFVVERAKTARHFIKASQHPTAINELEIVEITKDKNEWLPFLDRVYQGIDVGVISEAGCPGVADPGAEVVFWAHNHDIQVIPLVGPSSILMALMASGMSGQNFAFNGYLSNKKPELINQLKALEAKMQKTGQTQIFMETPYRNGFMIETILQTLQNKTFLCIACDINNEEEYIKNYPVSQWKSIKSDKFHKKPCIFILG